MPLDFAAHTAPHEPHAVHDARVLPHADPRSGWAARLALRFARRDARTVLVAREHDGPLVVQKPLYPEGDQVCHAIIVHPPAGIVGGDSLELLAQADDNAHVLLTTPGAGKWYRSAGMAAAQRLSFTLAPGACLEWLPQESILFDGARAGMQTDVALTGDAGYVGWEILCLGRTGSGEQFTRGECRMRTSVTRNGRPLWWERGSIIAGSGSQHSPTGLDGHTVTATMIGVGRSLDAEHFAATRAIAPRAGVAGVTQLPDVWIARYLGDSSEAAREYFLALWHIVRPALIGRAAAVPRIWRT